MFIQFKYKNYKWVKMTTIIDPIRRKYKSNMMSLKRCTNKTNRVLLKQFTNYTIRTKLHLQYQLINKT